MRRALCTLVLLLWTLEVKAAEPEREYYFIFFVSPEIGIHPEDRADSLAVIPKMYSCNRYKITITRIENSKKEWLGEAITCGVPNTEDKKRIGVQFVQEIHRHRYMLRELGARATQTKEGAVSQLPISQKKLGAKKQPTKKK
jgi:hypothetical protein